MGCCSHRLVSIPKSRPTDFLGSLPPAKLVRLSQALKIALDNIRAVEKRENDQGGKPRRLGKRDTRYALVAIQKMDGKQRMRDRGDAEIVATASTVRSGKSVT